ncbi:MAG: hypothetical protein ACN6O3_14385 [Comamonas sp.]
MSAMPTVFFPSFMAAVVLSACGGGGGSDDETPPLPVASYGIGGEVEGLGSGKSLLLQNNGGNDLTLSSNGAFEFPAKVEAGKPYNVTVAKQPQFQTCTVAKGSGIANAAISDIRVQCADDPANSDTSAACFSSDKPFVTGSLWAYITPTGKNGSEAMGESTFEGRKAYQVREFFINGNSDSTPFRYTYTNNIDGVNYLYGNWGGSGSRHVLFNYKETFTPPLAVPLSLPLNQPHTASYTAVNTNNIQNTTTQVVRTSVYLGRETIQTAFGTFETCKMQYTTQRDGGQPAVDTQWIIASGRLTGLVAQTNEKGTTSQPTNIEVNWN